MAKIDIASIPGDGIGPEVCAAAVDVLDRVGAECELTLNWRKFEWSCETYLQTGRMMPEDGLARLRDHDAIFLGAVGFPTVPDHVSLWGLLVPIRRAFDQYVNLRPARMLPRIASPLRRDLVDGADLWIIRENSEGEYSQLGGLINADRAGETMLQIASFSREGTDRIVRYAFEFAKAHGRRRVTSATKSNGLYHSMPYWDDRFARIASQYPEILAEKQHVDALCARLVANPRDFDVIVASNLFGDILSDLAPALMGSLAVAPSANLNPTGEFPSMFEPVHGSAPDIAGKNIANPIGQIWAGALMLRHLGFEAAAALAEAATWAVLAEGSALTPDLGGRATTAEVGAAISSAIPTVARAT